MKFKKDGEVFENIESAFERFECFNYFCRDCPLGPHRCNESWIKRYPAKAARLMGYEVIREPGVDFPMPDYDPRDVALKKEGKIKPLKDWTLEEVQNICAASGSDCKGCPFVEPGICRVNSIPEIWDLSEKPRFTEAEVAFAKAMYAVIPDGVIMRNSANRLSWDVPGYGMEAWDDNRLPYKMFPSIQPGQSVKLSDIVGGDTE